MFEPEGEKEHEAEYKKIHEDYKNLVRITHYYPSEKFKKIHEDCKNLVCITFIILDSSLPLKHTLQLQSWMIFTYNLEEIAFKFQKGKLLTKGIL